MQPKHSGRRRRDACYVLVLRYAMPRRRTILLYVLLPEHLVHSEWLGFRPPSLPSSLLSANLQAMSYGVALWEHLHGTLNYKRMTGESLRAMGKWRCPRHRGL